MTKTPATISVVIGTRPEAIKMAPVIRELATTDAFRVSVVSTGQHREMLKQVCDRFQIVVNGLDQAVVHGDGHAVVKQRAFARGREIAHAPVIHVLQYGAAERRGNS